MYVGYIFLIVFGIIFLLTGMYTLAMRICFCIGCRYNDKKPRTPAYPWYPFGGCSREEIEEIKRGYETSLKEYETSLKEWEDNKPLALKIYNAVPQRIDTTIFVIWIISIVSLILTGLTVTVCVLSDARTINQWKEVYVMIQQVVSNGSDLENIAISQTKIEYNEWLTNAIASLRTYGNWSSWSLYEEELLALQYIM